MIYEMLVKQHKYDVEKATKLFCKYCPNFKTVNCKVCKKIESFKKEMEEI